MASKVNVWLAVTVAALMGVIVGLLMNSPSAIAASSTNSGSFGPGVAGHITALAGYVESAEQPIYLIDSREEILLVYEYGLGQNGLNFIAARTFKYDKLLPEFDIRTTRGVSPSVEDVRKAKRRKKR